MSLSTNGHSSSGGNGGAAIEMKAKAVAASMTGALTARADAKAATYLMFPRRLN